jgi:hypothetical protein
MALPPLDDGALHDTAAWVLPAVALTSVGAPGVVTGVIALDALDAELAPAPFVAVTVNVYWVPLVKPVNVSDVPVVVALMLPGDDVTV